MLSALQIFRQFGFDPIRFLYSLRGLTSYAREYLIFRKNYHGRIKLTPYLYDRFEEGGATKDEYFWQDLIVARLINEANPEKHVDVGSRVDGFIGHVASFRTVEVLDIRPINNLIPGICFRQANLMSSESLSGLTRNGEGYCDSLSCLHALEHFGLGRYGDPVDIMGYKKGLANLSSLLVNGGRLYLSVPMGHEIVEFNANWVFNPNTILELANSCKLKLERFFVFEYGGGFYEVNFNSVSDIYDKFSDVPYFLGISVFIKIEF